MSDLEIIKKIEELVSQTSGKKIVLKEIEAFDWNTRGYILDKQDNVIGISLYECKLFNINNLVFLLKGLKNLEALDLGLNQIVDISPLKELKNLTSLHLDRNQIVDISPIKDFFENENFKFDFDRNPLEIPPIDIVKQG